MNKRGIAILALGLLFCAPQIYARQQLPLVKELQVKAGSLAAALKQLQQLTDVSIVYDASLLNRVRVSTHSYSNQSVQAILQDLLKGTQLQYTEREGVIIVKPIEKLRVPVKGNVTDAETGNLLPGVSIQVQHPISGSITNGSGQFNINADVTRDTLVLSYIGYKTRLIALSGKQEINIQLQSDASMLSSVVVVGYGETRKSDLTGAISHVPGNEFNNGVFNSPEQLIQGKVPGLNITHTGDPNGTPSVIMRGPSTLRTGEAQEPFYVIDGVPGASIQLLAPNDIESIDVLKDAASTAIYGSRAANGVIMVTTRRAKNGESWVSYNAYAATENVSKRIEMLSGPQLRKYLADNDKALNPSDDTGANTDWQKEVECSSIAHNHNISFGGGQNNTSYNASINYLHNDGIMKGSSLERLNARANLEQRAFNDKLRVNMAISNSVSTQMRIPDLVFLNMLVYLPTVHVKNPDGSYKEDFSRTRNYFNPVSLIDNNIDHTKSKIMLGNVRADLNILPGLDYTLNLSMQDEQDNHDIYYKHASALAQNTNGEAIRSAYDNTKKILETFLNYTKTFGKHNLHLLTGYSWQEERRNDGFQASNKNFVSDALTYNNLGAGNMPPGDKPDYGNAHIDIYRFISFYARLNYTFSDKYLLQVSAREDGSSVFGANNQWGIFPAVSAAWRLKQEPFLRDVPWLEDLKLRAGYGVSGNALGFGAFTAITRNNAIGWFSYNDAPFPAIGAAQNPNPNLKWESTGMGNIGLDFSFFKGRLGGSLDIYNKHTSDLIWTYNVNAAQYLVPNLTANAGQMSNKGIELQMNAMPLKGRLVWRTSFNIAHNTNHIESLSKGQYKLKVIPTAILGGKGQSDNWSQEVVEGQPLGSFYTWRYKGKDKNGVSVFQSAADSLTHNPQTTDFVNTGSAQPKLLYGWSNTFSYRNFELNIFLRGVYGNKILNGTLANLNSPSDATNYNIPLFTLQESPNDYNAYKISDRYLESGSYLRLDNATLAYNVPMHNNYISRLRLSVTANNLFIITRYRGIDPEVNLGGLEPGIDNNNFYPKTRSFLLGLSVNF